MTTPAICCRQLAGGYAHSTVLHGIDLSIAAGEMVGVVGPNGAGKTTLFRMLTGLLRPAAGQIDLFGDNLARLPADERARRIGVVPQEAHSPMPFTVAEIALMGRTATQSRWRVPGADDWKAVEEALRYTDAWELRDRPFPDLSGGEKQRALIAMALVQNPKILLLDEATSHLDIHHRLEILELVARLNHDTGVTVLMSSHDLGLTAEFSRRLLLLDGGLIAADGAPDEVLASATLRRVFRCELRVKRDAETGAVAVFPVRQKPEKTM